MKNHRRLQRFGTAALVAVIVSVEAVALAQLWAVSSYSLIVAGMVVIAWYAGLWPALAAIGVAGAVSFVWVAEPRGELAITTKSLEQLCLAMGTAVALSFVVDRLHRREEALHVSERRYRSLTQATTSVVWVAAANAQVTEPQLEWEAYTGQRWPAHSGTGFLEMVHPDDRQGLMERWQEALAKLEAQSFPARVWHDQSQAWHHCETFAVPLMSETGDVLEWIGTTHDVEDRYQLAAMENVRASDERTRLAESAAHLGTWEWDLGEVFVWSAGLDQIFGVDQAARQEKRTLADLARLVEPDDRRRVTQAYLDSAKTQQGIDIEFQARTGYGVRWLYLRGSYLPASSESAPARMVGVIIDITSQVETRRALSDAFESTVNSLALVDAIIDETPAGVSLFDEDMRFIRVNEAAAEINGLSVQAHLGRPLEELFPGVGSVAAARYREVWRTGRAMPAEEISGETPAEPGVMRWWEHSAVPVRDASGSVQAVAVIFNEITSRKQADEILRKAEHRQRFLSGATKEMLQAGTENQVLAMVGRLTVPEIADACEVILFDRLAVPSNITTRAKGQAGKALMRRIELRHWKARPGSESSVAQALVAGEAVLLQSENDIQACAPSAQQLDLASRLGLRSLLSVPLKRDDSTIGVLTLATARSSRVLDADDVTLALGLADRLAIVLENARLIAELRETTDDLRHANAAKDDFLGMVSHELKSPLTTIIGNADLLRRSSTIMTDGDRTQALDDVASSAAVLERLINDLLGLARLERGHALPVEPVILQRVIGGVVESRRQLSPERPIVVHTRMRITPVLAVPGYIEEVVGNLISNADKYSPESEEIEIEVGRQGSEVVIEVLDRGLGVAPEDAEHIFEPFYRSPRTAGNAPGLGIGLALCQRLVEAQGGRIWMRPRAGGGSAFGFALPVVSEGSLDDAAG